MSNKQILILLFTSFIFTQYSFAQQTPLRSIKLLPDEGVVIHSIDISKDEKYILTGSRKPILWDAESGEKIRTFSGHDEFDSTTSFRIGVLSADISPDLSTIVSGDNRANIVISNFNNGQPIFKIKSTNLDPSGGGIVGVAVMPDNKRVLSANGNGTMEMWNIETGELIKKYSKGGIKSIILLNDGRRVIMDLGVTIIVFDLDLGETIKGMQGIYPSVTSDNKILQIIGPSQQSTIITEIQHWDLSTYEIVKRFPIDQDAAFSSIDISPDGKNFRFFSKQCG